MWLAVTLALLVGWVAGIAVRFAALILFESTVGWFSPHIRMPLRGIAGGLAYGMAGFYASVWTFRTLGAVEFELWPIAVTLQGAWVCWTTPCPPGRSNFGPFRLFARREDDDDNSWQAMEEKARSVRWQAWVLAALPPVQMLILTKMALHQG